MLIIVRGLPGSGKSTYVRNHYPNIVHFENDMYFYRSGFYKWSKDELFDAIYWCKNAVNNSLKEGMDVVVSNTFIQRNHVQYYVNLAECNGHKYKVIRLNTNYGSIHGIPDEVYKNMKENFQNYPGEIIIS